MNTPSMGWLLFGPSGRISRKPFFLAILLWFLLQGADISQMFATQHHNSQLALWTLSLTAVTLAACISFVMLGIKRLHDMGFPGIAVLLLFVPVATFFVMLLLLFWPSAPPNQYGRFTNSPN